jgi:hypothetical protein
MTSSILASPPRPGAMSRANAMARERSVRRRVGISQALLVLNALTFYPGYPLAVPIPHFAGQAIAQGALPVALLMALTVNRSVVVRPNVFLCVVSLLVIEAFITATQTDHFGTVYRTFRLAEFVAVLWLLTPWWGRRDLLLVRYYLISVSAVLGSVLLGLLVHPSGALLQGRLTGAIWPIPPTQVAHYAAVTIGLVVLLWLGGLLRGRVTLLIVSAAGAMLLLAHTRTALVAMATGVLVASLSLFTARARVRKFFAAAGVVLSVVATTAAGFATTWLARGESPQVLAQLSGRTKAWAMVVSFPRSEFEVIFGSGLANKGFNGLPIDSNWLASYNEQGLFGVVICAAILLFLLVTAYFSPSGMRRALALFLVTYCLLASITEVGFTDASTYLLELTLAASLLVSSADGQEPTIRELCNILLILLTLPGSVGSLSTGCSRVASLPESLAWRPWRLPGSRGRHCIHRLRATHRHPCESAAIRPSSGAGPRPIPGERSLSRQAMIVVLSSCATGPSGRIRRTGSRPAHIPSALTRSLRSSLPTATRSSAHPVRS